MQLLPADYALCGLTLVLAVTGLFRGFSGTLAFLLATAASALAAGFCWTWSLSLSEVAWMRGAVVLVATLLVFGFVRLVVRRLVHGLLAQPADAVFGFLAGALAGAALVVGWAWSGLYLEHSALAREVAAYVG
ncbi:MAG: hypothetical protein IKE55_03415 [Kiritimatiellae bacterium]|nr:hypothetical protein [Kiritimatiellia bacterium]